MASWPLDHPHLIDELQRFRRRHDAPLELRAAVWPRPSYRGIINVLSERWQDQDPPQLNAVRMRELAAPLVRAGYWVSDAIPAHEAIKGAGKRLDAAKALLMAINEDCGAIVAPGGSVAYMAWPAAAIQHARGNALLSRYQFAAAVSPKIHALMRERADAVVAFGALPGLRSFVVPLIEELDQEVMVIDQADESAAIASSISTDPETIASMQVILATALDCDRPEGLLTPGRFTTFPGMTRPR